MMLNPVEVKSFALMISRLARTRVGATQSVSILLITTRLGYLQLTGRTSQPLQTRRHARVHKSHSRGA